MQYGKIEASALYSALVAALVYSTDLYRQQPLHSTSRWLRFEAGSKTQPTPAHFAAHLAGKRGATYAALFSNGEQTQLVTADDDHGGIEAAQAAVNALAAKGIASFAIARRSIHADGSERHNGSHLFVPLDSPINTTAARRTLAALLKTTGYSTSEILGKSMFPFGHHRQTPDGHAYGTLIQANQPPHPLASPRHGLELLAAAGYEPTSAAVFSHYTPAETRQDAPQATQPHHRAPISTGSHQDVVRTFNETYSVHEVFNWAGYRRRGCRNYHCTCGNHHNGDKTASIGVDREAKHAYFNAPACQYHNQGRPYTAFSLFQTIQHSGNYHEAINAARSLLNMRYEPPQHTEIVPEIEKPSNPLIETIKEEKTTIVQLDVTNSTQPFFFNSDLNPVPFEPVCLTAEELGAARSAYDRGALRHWCSANRYDFNIIFDLVWAAEREIAQIQRFDFWEWLYKQLGESMPDELFWASGTITPPSWWTPASNVADVLAVLCPTPQPASQPTSQPTPQPASQPTSQPVSQPATPFIGQASSEPLGQVSIESLRFVRPRKPIRTAADLAETPPDLAAARQALTDLRRQAFAAKNSGRLWQEYKRAKEHVAELEQRAATNSTPQPPTRRDKLLARTL